MMQNCALIRVAVLVLNINASRLIAPATFVNDRSS
jgi:hypothetical protein